MKFEYVTPPANWGDTIFRFLSSLIARPLARTPVTPNQITVLRGMVVIFALFLFARGDGASLLWAVGAFYLFEVLDHVDGDLARLTRRFSSHGPLLEQFIDTWSARPSNIFGLCVAIGILRETNSHAGFIVYLVTAVGRLLWLEYRDYFGWERAGAGKSQDYQHILNAPTRRIAVKNLFTVLYTWNNTFILIGALIYIPGRELLHVNTLLAGFVIVAILNNVPWIAIVIRGFLAAGSKA